ncbi:MAG: alpha/beta hydrolase [Acetobacteraceae bacterium]
MAKAVTADGVHLHYEETGSGTPVIFVHEFAGDLRSWEPQLRHFGRRYRAIAYSARGYPPSDIPESPRAYSQDHAADDILAVLDAAGVERAHVVGLSMGGFATLHFGFRHAARALSLCVAGCGYGAEPGQRERFPQRGRHHRRLPGRAGHAGLCRALRLRPDPGAVRGQGPARVRRVQAASRRAFGAGLGEHAARRAAGAAVAV